MATIVSYNPDGSVVDSSGYSWPSAQDFNIFNGFNSSTQTPVATALAGGAPTSGNGSNNDTNAAIAALSNTLGQADLQEKIREFNQTFGLSVGSLTGLYNGNATLPALTEAGYTYGPGGASTPTLTALQNAAAVSGLIAAGTPGVASNLYGTPTIGTQALTGYLNLPGQGYVPTTQEQQVQLQAQQNALSAVNNILQSNTSPANPFTYLSKLRGISNLGPTAAILRGALTGATGQTPDQLAQQPTVLNNTLLANLYGGYLNNPMSPQNNTLGSILGAAQSQTSANPSNKVDINGLLNNLVSGLSNSVPSSMAGSLASSLANSSPVPTAGGTSQIPAELMNYGAGNPNARSIQSLTASATPGQILNWDGKNWTWNPGSNPQVYGSPTGSWATPDQTSSSATTSAPSPSLLTAFHPNASPAATPLPTGFSTGQQAFNRLSPSLGGAYQNLIQTAGGENATDFAAGLKLANPEFAKAGSGSIANFGSL